MLFSFESETCYVLHTSSCLSLIRVIRASSETLLLMQQGACITCRKLIGMREWVHSTTCASFIPNSVWLFSLLRIFRVFLTVAFLHWNCLQKSVLYDDLKFQEKCSGKLPNNNAEIQTVLQLSLQHQQLRTSLVSIISLRSGVCVFVHLFLEQVSVFQDLPCWLVLAAALHNSGSPLLLCFLCTAHWCRT